MKTVKFDAAGSKNAKTEKPCSMPVFRWLFKKIYCDSEQKKNKKNPYAKEQIKDIRPGRYVQAPNMGEIYIGTVWAHMYPKRTKNVPKTGPKHTRWASL